MKKQASKVIVTMAMLSLGVCSLANPVQAQNNSVVNIANISMSKKIPHKRLPNSGTNPTSSTTSTTNVTLPQGTQESENWAGYAVASSSEVYTSVTGQWTVPTITSSNKNAVASQWIGLGGVTSDDLLQMGTIEEFQGSKQVNEVFWEKLPATSRNVMTVPAGAVISATISKKTSSSKSTSSTWNLSFEINGKASKSTISPVTLNAQYAAGIGTSAEWISEDPSNANGQLYQLANMGTISYTNAKANGAAINASGNTVEPIDLVSKSDSVLLVPSALDSTGTSFTTSPPTTTSSSTTSSSSSGSKISAKTNAANEESIRNIFGW